MNENDILSQQEIDALLKQTQMKADLLHTEDYLNELEQDALGEIGNISFGTAATALSTLLRQKVEITTPTVSVVSKQSLHADFPLPHVAIKVEYTDGFVGANVLVIRTRDAKIIADLMMGGDGTVDDDAELNELHLSAVAEAMNQMMGSASTSMSTVFDMFVNITPPRVDIVDFANPQASDLFSDEDILVKVSFRLIVGSLIDSSIMQLIPISFARTMLAKLNMGSMVETSDAASQIAKVEEQVAVASEATLSNAAQAVHVETVSSPSTSFVAQSANQNVKGTPATQAYSGSIHEPKVSSQSVNAVRVQPVQFAAFDHQEQPDTGAGNLDLLLDIPLSVTVELGRTKKQIRDILQLAPGSILELEKVAGEPVDILVNQKLIAKGEVVVIDENFGVRVTDIISPFERVQKLNN
ncbi:flagellar motor switch phosphatase FliY [Collibacillus ludicampi]|uniref:Flagellar motor switch phosphatase FliY n=1 Tax=Collibacillus ludicampi TaxID=2771369 RepID=A0AAV4LJ47_9BACL|nr:flagellar motor switch phosphatase FliY [Collibacillus ludicampi]GIM47810.1 flagellar motor switch phosphatase FliY [Collibacillus ludicampi]